TPKQVKGMESPCVIGYQLFDRAYFKQANTLLGQASEKVNVNRAKSGEARPAYAPDFNGVLTAFTRTQKALIVVEDKVNDLPHLLAPIKKIIDQANQKTPQATKTVQQSVKTTVDDWKKQVDGLLAQGKHQMAEEVFNQRLKATLPLSFAEYQARYRSSQGKILNPSVDLESHPNKAEPNKSQPETKITLQISNKACDNKNENNKGAQKLPSIAKKKKNKQSALAVIKGIPQPIPSRILSLPLPASPQQPQFLSATQVLSKKEGLINKASGLLNRFTESFLGVFFKFEELLHYRWLPLPEFNNLTLLDAVFTDKNKRVIFEHFLSKEPRLIRKFFTKFELDTIDFVACQPRKSKCIKYLFNEHTENLKDLLCQFNDSGFLINNLVTGYGHGLLASAVHKENEEYVAFLLKIKDLDVNKSGAVHAFAPLMIAIENGNMNIVDLLLNSPGIDVNKVDKEGYSPLLIAHNNRRVEAVRRLLDHPGINLKNGSLLRIACQNGHVQAVERLLMAPSVNINQTSLDGSTLLLLACEQGHVGVTKLLLGYPGIDINKVNKHGVSPLYIACQNGVVELVQLLSAYPELKVNDTAYCGVSPFYIACQKEHIEIIKLLAARPDIDLNKANEHGIAPLNVACQKGDIETMTLLLGRSAIQVNKADTVYGDTPLHIACKKENLKAIQLLIAHPDIKVDEVNKHGSTPLYISCQRRDSKAIKLLLEHSPVWITEGRDNDKLFRLACQDGNSEMVKLFLEHSNIEVNKAGEHGETLLSTACAKGDVRLIRLLLTHPTIDVNKANNNKTTPLLVACANGHVAVVKLLLAYPGIKVNEADEDGETPLFIACHNGFVDVVKLLLACPGIEANKAEKKNGDTPLFIACQHGVMGAVKLLVEHPEIEINKKSKDGVTPFYMACQSSFLPVVKLLLHSNHLDVNQVEPEQQYTPLLVSCLSPATRKNRELFRLLLENKANLYHKNSKGETALDIAFSQKNNAAVEEILSYAKKENLPLVSLMSSKTQEMARDWAFSLDLLLADHNRFFASHPLLALKQFVQQQLPDMEHLSVAQQKSQIYANS
ncbi:ankyrin repeat domain-containing protein, partial [uncultured Legionella sp.]|uniref:ankyrin repeat domain-containing protein n=1 Tax=uncultured Legionella sp. TaxID=210934 RepID=UPI002626D7C3